MKKKKIAFVNDTFLEGRGADLVIYELARRLGKKHDVFVIAGDTNYKEQNFKIIKIDFPKLFTGKIKDFNYFNNLKKLKNQIDSLKKDYLFDKIFICHGGLSPAFEKKDKTLKFIWMGSPPTKNIFRKVVSKYFKIKTRAHEIITISNFMREDLHKAKSYNTKIILLGVSEDFKPLKKEKDEEFMLYVGRLEKHKRIDELIRVAKKINFKLKIAGYGLQEQSLKILANKIQAPVEFLGRVSRKDLIKNYQRGSFFVSASHWEGFGLIFIEAAACGKPSIGYKKGSIPEVIIDNQTGFVVNSFEEFEKKARILKEDKTLRKKTGREALAHSKKFDWDKVVKEYEKII